MNYILIIHKPKLSFNKVESYVYNISDFSTKKIIYFPISDLDNNYIEISFFLNNENIKHIIN